MGKNKLSLKLDFNSPVILSFTILCFVALLLGWLTKGYTSTLLFSTYRSSLTDPLTYLRFFGHIIGHADWNHFMGNMMLLLIVGPLLEEKYGSTNILVVILITALVTGIMNYIFFPHIQLLGASGVVFAFILLSPFTSIKEGTIPITLILVAVIYIGQQVYQGIFLQDNVSNLTHILGGLVGAGLGIIMHKNKMNKY
ncbi:MAG: rhomboid family intramembrane serine protease [Lachnospiraceae bacterium]|nr:rhomboid family intramembrane serine protease [Lachnospiraceae bacterium]